MESRPPPFRAIAAETVRYTYRHGILHLRASCATALSALLSDVASPRLLRQHPVPNPLLPLPLTWQTMAFVNLVDQDLGLSLVHAVAVVNGWPLPKHDPALDVKLDEKDDIPDPAKIKSAKKRQEAEKRKAEREAALRLMEEKRAIEAKTQAEIKKNAVYVKLLGLADSKSYEELWAACLAASPKMQQLSEAGAHRIRCVPLPPFGSSARFLVCRI